MQAINPNRNIGFRQNLTDKNTKKKPLVIENSYASSAITTLSYIAGATSILMLDDVDYFKQDIKKHKQAYSLTMLMLVLAGIFSFKNITIPDFYGKTNDKKAKNFLVTQQAISTTLFGSLIACGISQAINKKPDRKGGIIAACLSGIALVASTISNIATWKNYKKTKEQNVLLEEQNN